MISRVFIVVLFSISCFLLVGGGYSQPTCNPNASVDGSDCVCNPGFVGDGVSTCGVSNAVSIALSSSPTSTTGAIVTLPLASGATDVAITGVTGSDSSWSLFQTDGSSQGVAMTGDAPWSVTNPNGKIYLQFVAGAAPGYYTIQFSYTSQSATVVDGIVVSTYDNSCTDLDDLHVTSIGHTTAPNTGDISISWLPSTYQFEFDIVAQYEHDDAIVLVDTSEFDAFTGDIRTRPTGSCSAHAALSSTIPFHALFQSAPTATSLNALSGEYLAYPDSSSTGWTTSAVNCSAVLYQRSFALNELKSCNDVTFSNQNDAMTGEAMLVYAGTIYIHTLQPADDSAIDESLGYAKFTQQFPWELHVYTESEALIQASTDQNRIHLVVRNFELTGSDMLLQIETQTQYQGVELPVVQVSDGSGQTALIVPQVSAGNAPCLTNAESDICVQQWIYTKPSWVDTDNAVYNFIWAIYGTSNQDLLTVPVSLKIQINDVKVVVGRLGDLTLALYSDLSDAVAATSNTKDTLYPWHVNERIYLRGDVAINPSDVPSFSLSYREVWLCYSDVIGYDITLANGGCLDASLSESNRVHLLANGAVQTGLTTAAFQAATNTLTNGASSVAAGFSFAAFPLTSAAHLYTIHAKVQVQSLSGRKRDFNVLVRREANSPSATSRLVIVPDQQQQDNNQVDITSWIMIGIGSIGVFAVVGLIVVGSVMIRQLQQRPTTTTPSPLNAV